MSTSIFTLIMNKITIPALKIMRRIAKSTIWIFLLLHTNCVSYSMRSGRREESIHSRHVYLKPVRSLTEVLCPKHCRIQVCLGSDGKMNPKCTICICQRDTNLHFTLKS